MELLKIPALEINEKDEQGMTPLAIAVEKGVSSILTPPISGHLSCVRELLKKGTIDVNIKDFKDRTALCVAVETGLKFLTIFKTWATCLLWNTIWGF